MIFDCKACGQNLEAAADLQGAEIACPACHARIMVPGPIAEMDAGSAKQEIEETIHMSYFPLIYLAAGVGLMIYIVYILAGTFAQYTWRGVACRIIESEVTETDNPWRPFLFKVRYEYERAGMPHTGNTFKMGHRGSDRYSREASLSRRYPAGSEAICYVNPRDPRTAILQRKSLFAVFSILAPLPFILFGIRGVRFIWNHGEPQHPEAVAGKTGGHTWPFIVVFCAFSILGAGILIGFTVWPIGQVVSARSWIETPCRILRAEMMRRDPSKSGRRKDRSTRPSFRAFILYEYEFNNSKFKNDRYAFRGDGFSIHGQSRKHRTVEAYRQAEMPTCFVNPSHPHKSVLVRRLRPVMLTGFLGLPLLWLGVAGLRGKLYRDTAVQTEDSPSC